MADSEDDYIDHRNEIELLRSRLEKLQSMMNENRSTEDLIRESNLRQTAILNNISDIAWLKDRECRFIAVNAPFGVACGFPPADLAGKTDYDIWPRDLAENYRADDIEVMRTGQQKRVEERLVGPDGRESWIETIKTPIFDTAGQVIGTTGIARDITDRMRSEQALRESEERYRALFETMAQGVVYQASDGRIISANPASERILGLTLDQMQGRTSMDPHWRAIREDGSDFPGDQHPAMEALRTGKPANGVIMGVFHPSQEEYRWILIDAVPEFMPGDSKPYQVYTTFTDITDRKRAEEHLRRRTHGLAALLDVSKSLVASLELQTVLQATTDGVTRLFGLDTAAVYLLDGDRLRLWATTPPLPPNFPEELRNAPLADHPNPQEAIMSGKPVFVPDMTTADLSPAEKSITDQRNLRTVLFLPLIAGVKAVGTLIVGSVGMPRKISEAETDLCHTLANLAALAVENARLYKSGQQYAADLEAQIVDRKRAEQDRLELERRLLHAQKLESLGVLAGGIAHDFNNLLMAVLGNLDLALRKLSPVSSARVHVEQSAQAARRATDLTRQMLAYSGKGRFVVKAMDLSELVEENAHLLRSSVTRTAALDLHLGHVLPAIEADAGQIQQVIMNLIINASEAIGDRTGRITITTGVRECDHERLKQSRIADVPPPGKFVYLQVSDTGCGMDADTQERLFDPFFSTKAMGRGLGMPAILGIVRGHYGALFVESSPGNGTSIEILFPPLLEAYAVKDAAAVMGNTAEADSRTFQGTVLVVDDEEIVRNVCKEMVQSFGMKVMTASDGREAVEVFRQHTDDISHVILDLTMPNMDGMSALKELVSIKPDVRVLLSSGFNEQESIQRLSGKGMAGFIQKPYSMTSLREALEKTGKTGSS